MTIWVVRGGKDLQFLPWFDTESVVGIGWSELPESPLRMSRQELAAMMRATYPDAPANTIATNTGQVWNFVNTIALGDLVVVPLTAGKSFQIGRVVGVAERRESLAQLTAVRSVEWEAERLTLGRTDRERGCSRPIPNVSTSFKSWRPVAPRRGR